MITDPRYAQYRLATSLFSIARHFWYSPALQMAVVRVLS
jgi:hypothetical protein